MADESQSSLFSQKKFLLPFLSAVGAMLVGALIFVIPPPLATQFHETTAEQYLTVAVAPDITIELDANSAITVTNSKPPKVELLQGNAYFDAIGMHGDTGKLEVVIGDVLIRNIGTRFSLKSLKNGATIAVANGQVEMTIGIQKRLVNAGQRIDFVNSRIIEETSIIGLEIAPWRRNQH